MKELFLLFLIGAILLACYNYPRQAEFIWFNLVTWSSEAQQKLAERYGKQEGRLDEALYWFKRANGVDFGTLLFDLAEP